MFDYLYKTGVLSDEQYGFINGRSCLTQLLNIMEIWSNWGDEGVPWDTIYLDFAKAFDSVPHKRLILKLKWLGIGVNLTRAIPLESDASRQRAGLGC